MTKPVVILDPNWRRIKELFGKESLTKLNDNFDVIWGRDEKIPIDVYNEALPNAYAIVAANPVISKKDLELAKNLKMIIEVSGTFPDTVDYEACKNQNIQVLSCAPGFHPPVAEMGLAILLSAARGLVREHEAFRTGGEEWLADKEECDFTLYNENIGIVGFGKIGQELARLLKPFNVKIKAYDPWLPKAVADEHNITLCDLDTLVTSSRALIISAIPTADNYQMINEELFSKMADNILIVLLSRAHLVDFAALSKHLEQGRFYFATDVFPQEPIAKDDVLRKLPNVLLSPHRAAAVAYGRQLIGEMLVDDLLASINNSNQRRLAVANIEQIKLLAGIGDLKNNFTPMQVDNK